MKITKELNDRLEGAGSEQKVKEILGETKKSVEEAGIILEDAELDMVAGGKKKDWVHKSPM